MRPPCVNCSKKGCGTYHDECAEYIRYKKEISDTKDRKIQQEANTVYAIEAKLRMKKNRRSNNK